MCGFLWGWGEGRGRVKKSYVFFRGMCVCSWGKIVNDDDDDDDLMCVVYLPVNHPVLSVSVSTFPLSKQDLMASLKRTMTSTPNRIIPFLLCFPIPVSFCPLFPFLESFLIRINTFPALHKKNTPTPPKKSL